MQAMATSDFRAGAAAVEYRRWLDKNATSLKGPVYGPIIADMDVDPWYARMFETVVPMWVRFAFVVTSADHHLIGSAPPGVSLIEVNPALLEEDLARFGHRINDDGMRVLEEAIGPVAYADTLLGGSTPPAVRVALCREAFLHDALMARNADSIEKYMAFSHRPGPKPEVRSLLSPEASLRIRTSARGMGDSLSRIAIQSTSFYLHLREDPGARAATEASIVEAEAAVARTRELVERARGRSSQTTAEFDRARTEHDELSTIHKQRNTVAATVKATAARVAELEAAQDEGAKQAEMRKTLQDVRGAQLRCVRARARCACAPHTGHACARGWLVCRFIGAMQRLGPAQRAIINTLADDIAARLVSEQALDEKQAADMAHKEKVAAMRTYQQRLAAKKEEVAELSKEVRSCGYGPGLPKARVSYLRVRTCDGRAVCGCKERGGQGAQGGDSARKRHR